MKILFLFLITSTAALAQELVPFNEPEGIKRFERSKFKVDFYTLANHFEAQSNGLFCGPSTATIILNSLRLRKKGVVIPKDHSVLTNHEKKYLNPGIDPFFNRYTQRNIFQAKGVKTFHEVMGKPDKNGKKDVGFQVRQFSEFLAGHGLKTTLRIVTDESKLDHIINELKNNLKTPHDFIAINYKRAELGQKGGGHLSPVGAYDEESDSFLIMDVNPNRARWVWVKSADLIKAMNTFDTNENRGYILVEDNAD